VDLASENPKQRRISVSAITTRDWDFAADVAGYKAAGLDAIGVWRNKLEAVGVTNGAAILQEHELPAANLVAIANFIGEGSRLEDGSLDDARRGLDVAAEIETDCVIAVPGRLHGRSPERAADLAVEALSRLAPEAAAHGVRLALEPIHPDYMDFLSTLEQTNALVRRVDHPAVGVLVDVWHLWQEPELECRLAEAGDRIFAVHLSDWREPTRGHNDRLVMGDGVIPLDRIVAALDAAGYDGYYDVEIFSEDLWQSEYPALLARCRAWFQGLPA
jgi:sugar phosphate isomerase/epimerase